MRTLLPPDSSRKGAPADIVHNFGAAAAPATPCREWRTTRDFISCIQLHRGIIDLIAMAEAFRSSPRPSVPISNRQAWIATARSLPISERLSAIQKELASLELSPEDEVVFFRKSLLRLQDESRLQAGLVTREQLHAENSPVTFKEMAKARIIWHPRRHA